MHAIRFPELLGPPRPDEVPGASYDYRLWERVMTRLRQVDEGEGDRLTEADVREHNAEVEELRRVEAVHDAMEPGTWCPVCDQS